MRFFTSIITILFILNVQLLAGSYTVKGHISDAKTGKDIIGASVLLSGTAIGDNTDLNGNYEINNIKSGQYKMIISYIGYRTIEKAINISNENLTLDFELQEKVIQTGEVIVSASKRVQAVQEVPISVAVIDIESLSDRNVTKLDEALAYVPGIQMNDDQVSVRGSSGFAFGVGSRVSLLLDGFPMLSGDGGDMKFDAIPLFNTERVEIIKGAGSALYGTSALGGVINVISKEASEKPELHLKAFSGIYTKPKYEEWEYSDGLTMNSGINLGYSQKFGDLGVTLSGSAFRDESYREYSDSRRYNLFSKIDYKFSDFTSLALTGSFSTEEKADWVYWNGINEATSPDEDTDTKIRLNSDKLSGIMQLKHIFNMNHYLIFRTGMFRTEFQTSHEESDPDYRHSEALSLNTEIQMNSLLLDNVQLTYGSNFIYNDVQSKIYNGSNSQSLISAYLQAELADIWNFTINAGARGDYEKMTEVDEHLEVSPKIGITYHMDEFRNFRASVGKGFRAPMVAERHSTIKYTGIDVKPNYGLTPEKSVSYELGYNFRGNDFFFGMPLEFDISLFQNDLYDLIEPGIVIDGATYIQFQNITRARIRGMELNVKTFLFGLFGLESGLTAMEPMEQDSISKEFNKVLKYRSKFLWYNRIIVPIGLFEFQADYRYLSKVENIDELLGIIGVKNYDERVPIHVVDARLIFHLKDMYPDIPLDITLNAKNLLDYYYVSSPGNLANTRYISLQLDAAF